MQKSKLQAILMKLISLEISKGHLKWTIADLARTSGVSRSLIYYHLGKQKKDILKKGFHLLASEFYGISPKRVSMMKDGRLADSLALTHKMFIKNPSLGIFYLKWRNLESPLKEEYLRIEEAYQNKILKAFPHLSPQEVRVAHAFLHGVVTSAFLNENDLTLAASIFERSFKLQR